MTKPREAVLSLCLALLGSLASACDAAERAAEPPAAPSAPAAPGNPSPKDVPMVSVRVFDAEGRLTGPVESPRVELSDAEWRARLTPEQFKIARAEGTERPFCGTLLDNKQAGVYACVCCGLPLFASASKFDSGTGWPSFFQPVAPENVTRREDRSHGMVRVEIECARCDGHLGHVFEDGPAPTGLRFCVNSESLTFTPEADLARLADPAAGGSGGTARAVFAGGCFWCVEAVFEELDGVVEAVSGYAGGTEATANYKAVCTGTTGHAEAVEIVYDPSVISYVDLLRVHFATHDPTTLDRQGADTGPQYRSAIFYADEEEKELARAFIADLEDAGVHSKKIVTTLEPLERFYPAESHHQNYVCNNPTQGYVRSVALPKVEKVRAKFRERLKAQSPLAR